MTNRLDQISERLTSSPTGDLQSSRELLPHPTIKGDASEARWINWLRDHLPRRHGVGDFLARLTPSA